MKLILNNLIVLVLVLALCYSLPQKSRQKRQTYELPDGAELLLSEPIRTGFQCQQDGYFADVDNNCQIFHVCHRETDAEGKETQRQWTFLCGNQTVFNQLSLTCSYEEESIPCQSAPSFFYLNERIGQPKVLFLEDNDIAQGYPLYPGFKNRNKK